MVTIVVLISLVIIFWSWWFYVKKSNQKEIETNKGYKLLSRLDLQTEQMEYAVLNLKDRQYSLEHHNNPSPEYGLMYMTDFQRKGYTHIKWTYDLDLAMEYLIKFRKEYEIKSPKETSLKMLDV